ncbi:hypothetical protein [Streptomyces sp. NRRL F-5755]|uniref:hypothetical protein n=1 Tax=Streptomyces sp. NRRL F-5755 TaxID=1519475 RepID=UPI000A8F7120|nr:hypothetical protein [Streptomyces sp. NRRL F-5755]
MSEVQTGDLLHVTGTVVQPDEPGGSARLSVMALQALEAAAVAVLHELVLDH